MTSRVETLLARATAQNKQAVDLAMIVSPAVRIEPAVLRTLRLEFLRASDPSAEADLWMSPLVGVRSASAITLVPEVASVLRQRLSEAEKDGALFRRIADRIADLHAGLSPLLRLEEKVIRLCHEGANPVDGIDAEMAPLVRTIHEQPDKSAVLASWAVRAIPRLPEAARRSSALWALALAGSARFGVQPLLEGDPPEGAVRLIPGLLPSDVATTSVEVRRSGATLELYLPVHNPQTPVLPGIEGGVLLEVPATSPVIVEVRDGTLSPLPVVLSPGARKHLSVMSETVQLRTLRGETFDLLWRRSPEDVTVEAPTIQSTSKVFSATIYQDEPVQEPAAEVVIEGRTIREQTAIPSQRAPAQTSTVEVDASLEMPASSADSDSDAETTDAEQMLLEIGELYELHDAVVSLSLSRNALVAGIQADLMASIPLEDSFAAQILVDLHALSRAGPRKDGIWPLEIWLRNAISLAGPRVEVRMLQATLKRLLERTKRIRLS